MLSLGHIDIKLSTSSSTSNSLDYPPSPPAKAQDGSKQLTLSNVAALPSSFASTIISSAPSDLSSDDDDSDSELSFNSANSSVNPQQLDDAASHSFLANVFGSEYLGQLTRLGMKISPLDETDDVRSGAVLESSEHQTRTLYCSPELNRLDQQGLVELMETADEDYECSGIVICMDKNDALLEETLHSLLYVGGSIVPPDAGMLKFSDNIVMVGLDL